MELFKYNSLSRYNFQCYVLFPSMLRTLSHEHGINATEGLPAWSNKHDTFYLWPKVPMENFCAKQKCINSELTRNTFLETDHKRGNWLAALCNSLFMFPKTTPHRLVCHSNRIAEAWSHYVIWEWFLMHSYNDWL